MTPVVAVTQPEMVDTAAGAVRWGRQLATIRAYYGDAWFCGRSVLALGCGREIDELATLGGRIVEMADGFDPDCDWQVGQVDLVLHLGLLSQLDAAHASLRHACAHAGNVVIETPVCDSHEDLLVRIECGPSCGESLSSPQTRSPRPGLYPSPARIERILVEHGMLFQRLADSRCNGTDQVYDWLATGSSRVNAGHRRLWFARKG